jgi:hypothetical protein
MQDERIYAQRLEGSRFGVCIRSPMHSVQGEEPPKEVANKRLPRITQRNSSPTASVPCGKGTTGIELPRVETFPGAACLRLPSAALRFSKEFVGFLSHMPKRLPSNRTPRTPELLAHA